MSLYADTSVLVAWFHPADEFARPVTEWCRKHSPDFWWNLLLRIELRHNLRRLSGKYAATAWQAYRASEESGRLALRPQKVTDLLEWGDELSARGAAAKTAGSWDCVHVAAAQHAQVDGFLTCDSAQAELARFAGLQQVLLFPAPRS